MIKAMFAVLALTGCSSLDDAVGGDVVSAEVIVAPAAPAALATVNATIHLVALSRADHAIAVDYVALAPPGGELRLDLAPVQALPFQIHPHDNATIQFVNAGATNAVLAPLCGQTVQLVARFAFLDDPEGGAIAEAPVAIACPAS